MQAIAPIGPVTPDIAERLQAQAQDQQLHIINTLVGGATLAPNAAARSPMAPAFDAPSLMQNLQFDLQHGFVAHRRQQLLQNIASGHMTPGAMADATQEIVSHFALSQLAEKVSTKLADSLNNIVTKQG